MDLRIVAKALGDPLVSSYCMQQFKATQLSFGVACNDDHAAIDVPEQGGCAYSRHTATAAVLLASE